MSSDQIKTTDKMATSPEWVQGFAAAVAEVARTFGQHTIARELMIGAGLTLADLVNAEVEAFDFGPIWRAMQ